MSNLYEILEVSEKASKEVIDKAYHVLAKKYHPDLQEGNKKKSAEKKMQKLNEAYEIIGNEEKRKVYDEELKFKREEERRIEEQNRIDEIESIRRHLEENINNQNSQSYVQNQNEETLRQEEIKRHRNIERQEYDNMQKLQNEMRRTYANAYNDYLRSLGYKIKKPWTFKRVLELLKVIGIFAIIIAVIWFFPPTNKLIVKFYEENAIVNTLVNLIVNILKSIWNAIVSVF